MNELVLQLLHPVLVCAGADVLVRDETGVERFRYPSYVQHIMGDIFSLGFGPFRYTATTATTTITTSSKELIVMYELNVVFMQTHFRAKERHLPYGITQCYLPPNTGERALP